MLRLARELNDKPAAIRYLQNRNILHNERDCDNGKSQVWNIANSPQCYNGIVNIPNRNFLDETVNLAQDFVDPVSSACTNTIECLWNIGKSRNRRRWGTHRSMTDSYMCEFMWRQRHRNTDLFERILLDIAQCYPLWVNKLYLSRKQTFHSFKIAEIAVGGKTEKSRTTFGSAYVWPGGLAGYQ